MRIAFALPGLHRTMRGAEVAFTSVATELARRGHDVTLIGSGAQLPEAGYRFLSAPLIGRERFEKFPRVPALRGETAWEEATFIPGLLRLYKPQNYDVTLTCSYPFTNWILRSRRHRGTRPAHVFVTQNGDWPAQSDSSEYRYFGCDGLVCTNPDYFAANKERYFSELIPNGVDLSRFGSEKGSRAEFRLPDGAPLILMVSALIRSKQVSAGIDAVSKLPGVHLAVAGDGPLRKELAQKAAALMPGRYHNFTVRPDRMPALYSAADLFLHLSRDESFGNVFIEAMASGLTTVAWDLPRTRWITGSTGRLVADGDNEALVTSLRNGLAQGDSKDQLSRRALQFSWQKIGGEYETFLMKVLERRSRY